MTRLRQLAGAAFLALSLNAPALAEKIEAIGEAKKEQVGNGAIIALFSVLNVIAGLAILSTIVFGVIWFLQRRDDDDEEEEEDEEEGAEAPSQAAPSTEPVKSTDAPAVESAAASPSEDAVASETAAKADSNTTDAKS